MTNHPCKTRHVYKCDLKPSTAKGMVIRLLTKYRVKTPLDEGKYLGGHEKEEYPVMLLEPYKERQLAEKLHISPVVLIRIVLGECSDIITNDSYMQLIGLYCQTKFVGK